MTDQERMTAALRAAGVIIAEYLQPGPRDPEATIQRLIEVLDSQELAAALERADKRGEGL